MYSVEVRDHIMVAHSLRGAAFGPAQALHGATFIVDLAFFRPTLGPDNVVVDIGRAGAALKAVLAPLAYANLDTLFPGDITTTEFLCRHIFQAIAQAARDGDLGPDGAAVERIRVTLHESHLARAAYEGLLADA
jgi:6-pyruvoyl-tetrahydropterin synthase